MKKYKGVIILSIILFVVIFSLIMSIAFLINNDKTKDKKYKPNIDEKVKVLFKAYLNKNLDDTYELVIVGPKTKLDKSIEAWEITNEDYKGNTGKNYEINHMEYMPWYKEKAITKVTIKDRIRPVSTAAWFSGLTELKEIEGLDKIDSTNVLTMAGMFYDCSNLETIDLSSFKIYTVISTAGMFNGCTNLKTIYIDNIKWNTGNVSYSNNMFNGCTSLTGGNGTIYNQEKIDKEYARVDTLEQPGYFTQKQD